MLLGLFLASVHISFASNLVLSAETHAGGGSVDHETIATNETDRRKIQHLETPIAANSKLCENVTVSEADISRDFFGKHRPWERPLINARKPIEVEVRLVLSSVNDIIEKEKILKLTGYLLFYWYDEFHVWNKTLPHACLSSVAMPREEVWVPELAMINSEQHYELLYMHNEEMVRVYSTGYISYRPGGTFRAYCDFDLRLFPFDEQVCVLTMESWRYTVDFQRFHFGDSIQTRYWIENEQWLLKNTSQQVLNVQYVIPTNVFSRVEFTLKLKRKIGYYLINVIVPSVIISIAEIATFTLPVDEVMKIHISFTCLLAYGIFQLMIIEDIPRTSDRIPLLCYYIALSMAYICLAMLGLVFVCVRKGSDQHHRQFVPEMVYEFACVVGKFLNVRKPFDLVNLKHSFLGTVGSLHNKEKKENEDSPLINNSPHYVSLFEIDFQPSTPEERAALQRREAAEDRKKADADTARRHRWEFVADVLDRLVLVIYLLCIILTPFIMFAIIPNYFERK